MMEKINQLNELIKKSKHIVFLTGAGISKASGIPDIRGKDGLKERLIKDKQYNASYEEIVSSDTFYLNPKLFFTYYFNEMIYKNVEPNVAHKYIAKLNNATVVTQNIDGLHTKAGSKKVLELHGSVFRNTCLKCGKNYTLDEIVSLKDNDNIPHCSSCKSIIKPDVTLFGEQLNQEVLEESLNEVSRCDLMIVIGSSLVVNPAASLPYYLVGAKLVIINNERTPLDSKADLIINEDINSVFKELDKLI